MTLSLEVVPSNGQASKMAYLAVADRGTTRQIFLLRSFGSCFLHLDLQGLSGVENELLEIPPIDKLLELLPEGATVDRAMSRSVMKAQ